MNRSMFNLPARSAWGFLLGAVLLLFLFGGGSGQPAIGDECRVAGIAMETAQEGNYLLPRLNGVPFVEYPPLYYWCAVPWLKIFGATPWGAHTASLLIGALMGIAIFGFARTIGLMPGASLFTAMLLLTNNSLLGASLMCRVDILLAFFALIGWWGGALCWVSSRPRPAAGFLLMAAGLAGAFLTKNLAGGVLIVSGLGGYLLVTDVVEKRFRFRRYLLFAGAFLLALVPYGLYLWRLQLDAGWKAVEDMAFYNNFGRFSGSRGEHSKPVWFYLLKLPEQFQPWLILLLVAIVCGILRRKQLSFRWLYPAVLLGIPFLLLSIASGKRQVYLLPLVTPAALFTGVWLDFFLRQRGESPLEKRIVRWLLPGWRVLLCAAAVTALTSAVVARVCGVGRLRFELGAVGVFALGIVLLWLGRRKGLGFGSPGEQLGWTWVFLAFAIGVSMGSFRAVTLRKDTYDPVFQMLETQFPERQIFLYNSSERISGAAYYYRMKRTPELHRDPKAAAQLPAGSVVLTASPFLTDFPEEEWERVPVPKWTKLGVAVRRNGARF